MTMVTTIESAFNLDTCAICLFVSKDGERRSVCRKVQFRHFPTELFRRDVDVCRPEAGTITPWPSREHENHGERKRKPVVCVLSNTCTVRTFWHISNNFSKRKAQACREDQSAKASAS